MSGRAVPTPPVTVVAALDRPVGLDELTGVELLACLPAAAREELATHARRRAFAPGEVVFHEGEPGDALHVVSRGVLAVMRPSLEAGIVLSRLEPGAAFGEIAVLSDGVRSASVIAVDHAETVELRKQALDAVLEAHPAALRKMIGGLAASLTLAKEEVARHNQILERRVRERTEDLRDSQLEFVNRLAHAAESRDDDTGVHIARMSRMCAALGRAAGLTEAEADELLYASSMHDIGKIAIPDAILLKPGPLSADEWEVMKTHTETGAGLLAGSRSPVVQVAEVIARTHHERWDGTGYPNGLAGTAIPLVARICAVCDVFDALVSDRPYKNAWPIEAALAEFERIAGTHLDPRLVELFVTHRPDLTAGAED